MMMALASQLLNDQQSIYITLAMVGNLPFYGKDGGGCFCFFIELIFSVTANESIPL
jgi:hypothetical protein